MDKSICKAFSACNSCILAFSYEEQKKLKVKRTYELFDEFFSKDSSDTGENSHKFSSEFYKNIEFFETSQTAFRSRAEFRLWHENDKVFYAMNRADKKPVIIEHCAIVNEKISSLMPRILDFINANEELKSKIFGCEFVASTHSLCAILLYHKNVELIKSELESLANILKITLIARSRGKKLVFGDKLMSDEISLKNTKLHYTISPDGFIQPNAKANEKMLNFVYSKLEKHDKNDLCELYCGHGNFTLALAPLFRAVMATEINKTSIELARQNAALNNIKNVTFARLSADEFTQALRSEREFNRLKGIDLKNFDFSHILVDPPRAGCDENVLNLMKNFNNIIYISCSQNSLKRDLNFITKTHKITDFALFDQFAHTEHIESICLLKKF